MTHKKRKLAKSLGEVSNENIGFWGALGSMVFPYFVAPIIAIMNWEDNPKKAKQAAAIGAVSILGGVLWYQTYGKKIFATIYTVRTTKNLTLYGEPNLYGSRVKTDMFANAIITFRGNEKGVYSENGFVKIKIVESNFGNQYTEGFVLLKDLQFEIIKTA